MNWLTTLTKLVSNPKITGDKYNKLLDKSGQWPTCACGQLCKKLPREKDGEPKDRVLYRLGMGFVDEIIHKDWKQALKIFKKIERRSALLLKEQQHGHKLKRQK